MTTFIILFIVAMLILIGFIAFILVFIGIGRLESLSDSYYELMEKKNWYKYLFQITLLSVSFLLVPVMLQFTPEQFQFLAFFTAAPIAFVACAPRFRISSTVAYLALERKVHKIAAIVSGVSSALLVLAIAYTYGWDIALTIPIASFLAYAFYKVFGQKLFFAEMACFAWTLATIIILFVTV